MEKFISRVESEVADFFVFSRMMGFLGYSRVKECPTGLEHSKGARNTRKVNMKIQKNVSSDSSHDTL